MIVIILSSAQADIVRGPSAVDPLQAIRPIELTDGTWFVGEGDVSTPAHAAHAELFASLPHVDYETIAHLIPPPPEDC